VDAPVAALKLPPKARGGAETSGGEDTPINVSIKGSHEATHGQGEAASQHNHRGQQTLRHEMPQEDTRVGRVSSLRNPGSFFRSFSGGAPELAQKRGGDTAGGGDRISLPLQDTPSPEATADTAHSAHRQHCSPEGPPLGRLSSLRSSVGGLFSRGVGLARRGLLGEEGRGEAERDEGEAAEAVRAPRAHSRGVAEELL